MLDRMEFMLIDLPLMASWGHGWVELEALHAEATVIGPGEPMTPRKLRFTIEA
jgi:hypothetical protein